MQSPGGPDQSYLLTFREGVTMSSQGGVATVELAGASVPLKRLSPGLTAALGALGAGGATEAAMAAAAEASEGPGASPLLFYYLGRFKELGFLAFSAGRPGSLLATLENDNSSALCPRAVPAPVDPAALYSLSRFACLRRDGACFVVESPLSRSRVVLHDAKAVAVCHALATPSGVAQLSEICAEAPAVLGLLIAIRAAAADEVEGSAAAMWSFHDLLFHTRSRFGRHLEPLGATFRFAGKVEPLPALKPPMQGERVPLFRPDLAALTAEGPTLTGVIEERRSLRAYGARPIDAREVGELLYRTARVRSIGASSSIPSYPTSSRPYPGGGACYELELYLAVRLCQGLGEGLYHYEPQEHALVTLSGRTKAVDALLAAARGAMAAAEPPQLLLIMAARFGRVMWKYESMAYATILKDVGALYQTVYLVATAMKLSPSALGSGDADLFAAAAGLDYLTETSVGEMALGSRAP